MRSFRFGIIIAFAATAAVAASACTGQDSASDDDAHARCAQLRDHLVDLDVQYVTADRDAHRAAVAHALGDRYVEDCAAHRSPSVVTCELAAGTLATAAHCEGSPATAEVTP